MSKVAILKTSSRTAIEDYSRLMHLADCENFLPKENKTIIKLNLSWSLYYPACSTPPWQLEGVLKTLREDNYKDSTAVENQTVVTHPWKGAYYNKWLPILNKYDVEFQPLTDVEWVPYKPKTEMLAMYDIFMCLRERGRSKNDGALYWECDLSKRRPGGDRCHSSENHGF